MHAADYGGACSLGKLTTPPHSVHLAGGRLSTMEPPRLPLVLLRQLLRGLRQQGPSPASRAPPGYLRAFTAEVAPQVAAEEGAAAAAAAAAAATAEAVPAASVAAEALLAAVNRDEPLQEVQISAFQGLTDVLAQQQANLAGGGHPVDRMSPALRAMTWHQRYMDDTPAGRELRRNWQRQVRRRGCPAGHVQRSRLRALQACCGRTSHKSMLWQQGMHSHLLLMHYCISPCCRSF